MGWTPKKSSTNQFWPGYDTSCSRKELWVGVGTHDKDLKAGEFGYWYLGTGERKNGTGIGQMRGGLLDPPYASDRGLHEKDPEKMHSQFGIKSR